jgi:hypothetical protein
VTPFPERHGLQPERTALAWSRSVIVANGMWLPLIGVQLHRGLWVLAGLSAVSALAATTATTASTRHAELRAAGWRLSPYPRLVGLAVAIVAAAAGGLATAAAVVWT